MEFKYTQSVSELNEKIKSLVEVTFTSVVVEGEVSNFSKSVSGHSYFTLKDELSSIRCMLSSANARNLKFELKNGQRVVVIAKVTMYIPRGDHQLFIFKIFPSREKLSIFEEIKNRLEKKGYFDPKYKKNLPLFPKKIAVITSSTSAALQDILCIARSRWPCIKIVNYDTLVQGLGAAHEIAQRIQEADSLFNSSEAFDIILIARGGGTSEDLWVFNEEIVAEAIFRAKTPVVSAIGHEIDFVISDFVADKRAPTPSGAMEIILPDAKVYMQYLDELLISLSSSLKNRLSIHANRLEDLDFSLDTLDLNILIDKKFGELDSLLRELELAFLSYLQSLDFIVLRNDLDNAFNIFLESKERLIAEISSSFKAYFLTDENPFYILYNGKKIDWDKVRIGDRVEIVGPKGIFGAIIEEIQTL